MADLGAAHRRGRRPLRRQLRATSPTRLHRRPRGADGRGSLASRAWSSASATRSPSTGSTSRSAAGEFFSLLGAVGLRQDHDAADDRRLRAARRGHDPRSTGVDLVAGRRRTSARSTPSSSPTRSSRSSTSARTSRSGCATSTPTKDEVRRRVGAALELVQMGTLRRAQAAPALRRPAAAGRAGPGAGPRADRAAARRADGRPRRQAAQAAAGRAAVAAAAVGTTFVYVTHDQEEALTMSRPARRARRRQGRCRSAPPSEVYSQPAGVHVATFLGTTNLCEVDGRRDRAGRPDLHGRRAPARGRQERVGPDRRRGRAGDGAARAGRGQPAGTGRGRRARRPRTGPTGCPGG